MPKSKTKKRTNSNSNTLGAVLERHPNKIIRIYLTSEEANVLANSVVIVKDGKARVFTSISVVDAGNLATSSHVSAATLADEVIPNASKAMKFSKESGSARLRILQMEVGRIQKIKNSCSIKNGRRK